MEEKYLYILLFVSLISCEEIYNPHLNTVDNNLVIEAKLFADNERNIVRLYKSKNIGVSSDYEKITNASVTLINNWGEIIHAHETDTAGTYSFDYRMDKSLRYYLKVEAEGEEYVSDYQSVPEEPSIDTVYYDEENYVFTVGTSNSTQNITSLFGIRLFTDISDQGKLSYYRFTGRKIYQYTYSNPVTGIIYYAWTSFYPPGVFNIAEPPEYGSEKSITKHPLEFFVADYKNYIGLGNFTGWIYIIDEYGLNENTYNYYSDLNSQLNASGKIFDQIYTQAKGNVRCTTNSDIVVLGNFEISSHKEYRYFLKYYRDGSSVSLKPIPYFYNIPWNGANPDTPPDFWETTDKLYPGDE